MRGKPVNIDINELGDLYVNQNRTMTFIADYFGFSYHTVRNIIDRHFPDINSKSCTGEKNSRWRGGIKRQFGYVFLLKRGHPHSDNHGYIREHILVWEDYHNKPLPDGWCIHHKNGIKDDNRIENLEAMPSKKHNKFIPMLKKRIRDLENENRQLLARLQEKEI